MAKLPPVKRFLQDDYQGVTEISTFAAKLFYPLNLFLNAVYTALNNGLTLKDNTIGTVVQSTSITADVNGLASTTINWPYLQSPPTGVTVFNCSISSVAAIYPLISWSYSSGVVSISMQFVKASAGSIVISASQTYSVGFWVSGG